jgi:hypothetical protein
VKDALIKPVLRSVEYYSTHFTNHARINRIVKTGELSGAPPVLKHLSDARIGLVGTPTVYPLVAQRQYENYIHQLLSSVCI